MRTSTALNHRARLDARLADLWSSAKWAKMAHADIITARAEIMGSVPTDFPVWAREWIRGRDHMRLDSIYGDHGVKWFLILRDDGTTAERWEELTDDEKEGFRTTGRKGFHAWASDPSKRF